MNQILVKVKRRRKAPYFKLISNCSLYETIEVNLVHSIDYCPDHNLDEESWFKIEGFKNEPYCLDLLTSEFDSKNFLDLEKKQFIDINCIISVQDQNFYFQKVTPALFIKRKTLCFGDTAKVDNDSDRLVVNELPDAIYYSAEDILVFKNLATISSIFKGIDQLYKEATEDEVIDFLNEEFITLDKQYTSERVSKPNRKRIALAMNALNSMSDNDKIQMFSYISTYCDQKLELVEEDTVKTFRISNDEELKLLLYGIEQRFYTTPFGKERRLANSVISID